jgi:hypothetical protein
MIGICATNPDRRGNVFSALLYSKVVFTLARLPKQGASSVALKGSNDRT